MNLFLKYIEKEKERQTQKYVGKEKHMEKGKSKRQRGKDKGIRKKIEKSKKNVERQK